MKIFKKKSFWIIIVILVIGGAAGVSALNKGSNTAEYVTALVEKGMLTQTVSATGSVESATEIEFGFETAGKLSFLNTKVGEQVKRGQVLASLDSSYQSSQVANYQAAVAVAQANLDKELAGASGEDIEVSQKKVESAEATLAAKETALDNLEASHLVELDNFRNTSIDTLNNKYFVGVNALQIIDDTLSFEDAQDTLSLQNLSLLTLYNNTYPITVTNLENTQPYIDSAEASKADNDIIFAIDQLKISIAEISSLAELAYEILQNTTLSPDLSVTELDGLKADIATEQTNLNTALTALQTSKNNLVNADQEYKNQVKSAQDEIASAQAALAVAQAELQLKMAGPRDFTIDYYQAQLAQAQANLNAAYSKLGDYRIVAPVDGTITEINNEIGEQVSLSDKPIKMIGESNLQIEVDIPESDIAKVKNGDLAEITLDAFGDSRVMQGSVTFIDPAATFIQDVVYYKVKVSFNEQEEGVKPGMSANVDIITMQKDDVLMIPSRAVKKLNGDQVVEVLENGVVIEKKVTTGFRGDEAMQEILSGLSEGEEVITYTKNGN